MLLNIETFLPVDTDGTTKEKITYCLHKKDIKVTGHFVYSLKNRKIKERPLDLYAQ